MLSIAYEIIKKADRRDVVILGGLVTVTDGTCETNPFVYLSAIYQNGAWNKFDAIGFHPYWEGPPEKVIPRGKNHNPQSGECLIGDRASTLLQEVRSLHELSKHFGEKPIWITEIGWNYPITDLIEAEYLVRTYVPLLSEPGVEKIFWYTQVADNQTEDFVLGAPGLNALGNLAHLLTGSQPLGQIRGQADSDRLQDDDIYEYRFLAKDSLIIIVWRSTGGDNPREIILRDLTGEEVEVYLADVVVNLENRKIIPIQNGEITLPLTERPLILIIKKTSWIEDMIQKILDDGKESIEKLVEETWDKIGPMIENWLRETEKQAAEWIKREIRRLLNQLALEAEKMIMQCLGSLIIPLSIVAIAIARKGNDV